MTVLYESKRFPIAFQRIDVGRDFMFRSRKDGDEKGTVYPLLTGPRNGALATASLIGHIIENEHWLALADVPMINFFEVAANGDNHPSATAWTNSSKTIRVTLPPFCRWAEFHFLCARDMNGTDTNTPYISVTYSPNTSVHTGIPFGEDLTITGKSGLSYYGADWIHFTGINDVEDSGTTSASALRLLDDATEHETWEDFDVTVTVSEKVSVYAAAYRAVPAFGTLQVQT